jgi:hypothetical protein
MPRDELRRLPDHVVKPLLRAFMAIPPRSERLILRRSERPRPPTRQVGEDYNVIRHGRTLGRIWCHDYTGAVSGEMARHLWHWHWRDVQGRADASGHAPTLDSAMADFRRAWDCLGMKARRLNEKSPGG